MSADETPVHSLLVNGTGFFSKGTCTACDWESKGHPDDIRRRWEEYHPDGGARVIPLPTRAPIPPPAEDPQIQRIESLIIVALTRKVDFAQDGALFVAAGLAQARCVLLDEKIEQSSVYIATMAARIAHLTRRQREKLRHPSRNREEQQRILDGEAL